MALAATTIWEVETGGSDTANGGAFDPGQTAGMNTDGAATVANTAAPVFTSASYTFVAGDVGAWVYIASGTNWIPGWYKISSVAAGAATLDAALGHGVLQMAKQPPATPSPTTATGCATVASPTSATWSIDYSQQSAAQYTFAHLTTTGTGLVVTGGTGGDHAFGKQDVGNSIVITGGTNFNAGRYVIASVAAGAATVVGPTNISTGSGSGGTGGEGGALVSMGQAGAVMVANNSLYIQSGSYTISSATANVAGGCFSCTVGALRIEGYGTYRGDLGTRPVLTAGTIATFTMIADTTSGIAFILAVNLILDGASKTSSRGFDSSGSNTTQGLVYKCLFRNFTNRAVNIGGANASPMVLCEITGCSGTFSCAVQIALYCESHGNTSQPGFVAAASTAIFVGCTSYGNTGQDGFQTGNVAALFIGCVAYGNGRDGFRIGTNACNAVNCIAEGNTGVGFNSASNTAFRLFNCGVYNNTGGNFNLTSTAQGNQVEFTTGLITATSTFFSNAAGADFSLNNVATGGALARAAGFNLMPSGNTKGYLDIGAFQHQDSPATVSVARQQPQLPDDDLIVDLLPVVRKVNLVTSGSTVTTTNYYVFNRRTEFHNDEPAENPRRVTCIASLPHPIIVVRRTGDCTAVVPWMNPKPSVIYAPVTNITNVQIAVRRESISEQPEATGYPRRAPVIFAPVQHVFVRRTQETVIDPLLWIARPSLVYAPVISNVVNNIFVNRANVTEDVEAQSPSRRSMVFANAAVITTTTNVFVKRASTVEHEEIIGQRKTPVIFAPVQVVFIRRTGEVESEPLWISPRAPLVYSPVTNITHTAVMVKRPIEWYDTQNVTERRVFIYAPFLGPADTPIVNRITNQYFYEEEV